MDTVDRETRSRIMSRIRGKDTGPELLLRSALHRAGLRYRLHDRTLPGSPDIVLRRHRAVVFVHGCYWHAHGCHLSSVPATRTEYWTGKFEANRRRDERSTRALLDAGWRVLVVWECALTGRSAQPVDRTAARVARWLRGPRRRGEIAGRPAPGRPAPGC